MMKLAVFGDPVRHSLSPRIHGMFAEAAGLEVEYDRIDCPAGQLSEKLDEFRTAGGRGCNLTVPLKAEGLALADTASDAAGVAAAANTLVWRNALNTSGWFADNTDGAGLVADLRRLGVDVSGRRVLILGAGGAVAGVLGPLLEQQPACICLLNRSGAKAERLITRFERPAAALAAATLAGGPRERDFDLLIQGTSLGHQGQCPPVDPDWMAPGAVGYDLNYGDAFAPFRTRCKQAGLACHSGLGMLVEQAALAFERFTGTRPETGPVHEMLSESPAGRGPAPAP